MKKTFFLFLLFMILLPVTVFSQVQLGPTALYNFPLVQRQEDNQPPLNLDDFSFGGDVRFKIWLFQVGALGLYTPGQLGSPASIDVFLNGGLSLDLLFLRLSAGIGPSFSFLGADDSGDGGVDTGSNARLSADLKLGKLAFSLYYLMNFPFDFTDFSSFVTADKNKGFFGLSLLFSL